MMSGMPIASSWMTAKLICLRAARQVLPIARAPTAGWGPASRRCAKCAMRGCRSGWAMSAREALRIATRGGAEVLGRRDCGQIAAGLRADIAIWDMTGIEAAGSWDPAALLLAGPVQVRDLFIEGRRVVASGHLATLDLPRVIEQQNAAAARLAERL